MSLGEAATTDGVDLDAIVAALHKAHPEVPVALIQMEAAEAASSFKDAKVTAFLPVLIERHVKTNLHLRRRAA